MSEKKPLRTPFQLLSEEIKTIPEEQLNFVLLKHYCIDNEVIMSIPYKIKLALYQKLADEENKKDEEEEVLQ